MPVHSIPGSLRETVVTFYLSHAKISRGFVKNRLKITSETKEWQKIILKPCGLVGFPAKKTTRVIFPLKKHTRAVFLLYSSTN
jgi:hypothetical protein